jgi:hypothetical protein
MKGEAFRLKKILKNLILKTLTLKDFKDFDLMVLTPKQVLPKRVGIYYI